MKTLLCCLAVALLAFPAYGQTAGTVKDGKVVRSAREDIARLEKELAEQKALLLKILQLQLEHDQQLLKLVQGQGYTAPAMPQLAPAPAQPAPVATATPRPEPRPASEPAPSKKSGAVGTVTGTLKVRGANGPAWVFVETVRGPAASGSISIKQEDKQFSPRLAVVPRGTRVEFPNLDAIFHNVFSVSVGNEFDLGTARKGDPVKSQVMANPGVVEIFCNMHSRMSASVLVAPSSLFARVASDGSFRLEGVPVGTHKISAWAGGQSRATQEVEVTTSGGQVELQLDVAESGAHKNKNGQSYGSYGD